jgi:hypothetical protein
MTSTALALRMTLEAAFTVIPFVLSSTELPLLSVSTTAPGPSSSVSFWPPGEHLRQPNFHPTAVRGIDVINYDRRINSPVLFHLCLRFNSSLSVFSDDLARNECILVKRVDRAHSMIAIGNDHRLVAFGPH